MKNEFMFKVGIRSGRRTKPEVWVTSYGSENEMRVGKDIFSKGEIANWIRSKLLAGLKKAADR